MEAGYKDKAQHRKQARKRQEVDKLTQEASAGGGTSRATKSQKPEKEQPALPLEGQPLAKRRELDSEGFSQMFRRRPQVSQDQIADTGSIVMVGITPGSGTDHVGVESDHVRKPKNDVQGSREGEASSSAAGSHGHFMIFNSFADLEAAKRAEE
eukprot:916520-Heterocapsa_arctica.AAC.1